MSYYTFSWVSTVPFPRSLLYLFHGGDRLVVTAYQPALQTLRIRPSPRRYAKLMNRLTALLAEFADEVEQEGEPCTLAVIGYRDP